MTKQMKNELMDALLVSVDMQNYLIADTSLLLNLNPSLKTRFKKSDFNKIIEKVMESPITMDNSSYVESLNESVINHGSLNDYLFKLKERGVVHVVEITTPDEQTHFESMIFSTKKGMEESMATMLKVIKWLTDFRQQ